MSTPIRRLPGPAANGALMFRKGETFMPRCRIPGRTNTRRARPIVTLTNSNECVREERRVTPRHGDPDVWIVASQQAGNNARRLLAFRSANH